MTQICTPYANCSRDHPADCACGSPLAGDNDTGVCFKCRMEQAKSTQSRRGDQPDWVSYCAAHDTFPDEGEPCWQCANPHIAKAYKEGLEEAGG